MKKIFVAIFLVGAISFLQIFSIAHAEIKTYTANNTALLDFGDESSDAVNTAKKVAELRAIKSALEKAGYFISSLTETLHGNLTDADISAITRDICDTEDVKFEKFYFNAKNDSGEYYGRPGYVYEATVRVKIDSDKVSRYLNLDATEKQNLIERDQLATKNFEEVDKKFEDLRKNANEKTPAQIKSELEQIDRQIKTAEKPTEQNLQQKNLPMIFSQPVEIGNIHLTNDELYNYEVENASYSDGKKIGSKKFLFETAHQKNYMAVFGEDRDAIYYFYKPYDNYLGGKNKNFLVNFIVDLHIYRINNTNNTLLYILQRDKNISLTRNYVLLGKNKFGEWVNYFDTNDLTKKYFEENSKPHIANFYCEGDTLRIEYEGFDERKVGEFRFKWDEAAQWFGVEKITY